MAVFDESLTALLLRQAFLGTLTMKLKHIADESIPTACVSLRELRYNPKFFATLSDDIGMAVVAHEVTHAVYRHVERSYRYADSGAGPDGKAYNHTKFNIAQDYIVNATLLECGFKVDRSWYCDPKTFPASMTPEEVYCKLPDDPAAWGGSGSSMDQHGHPSDARDASGNLPPPAITEADIMQAAAVAKATRGTIPASFERVLGELRKPKENPWKQLRAIVMSSLRGYDTTSWRRLQRRMLVRGIGMPGPVAHSAGRIGIVGDTSGSIDQKMLDLFAMHMGAIVDAAKPQEVIIYWTDAKVQARYVARNAGDFKAIMRKPALGGGGTDMPQGVRAAEEDDCDSIVVLTDGYTPFCDSRKKLVWAITSDGITSPHGRTVHIRE